MHLHYRNVNDAFAGIVLMFHTRELCNGSPWTLIGGPAPISETSSRNGGVLVINEPVLITYSHPTERVLFNPVRDANPFFHLYEALWMLAGRRDVASLAQYNSRIHNFSDDEKVFNGAYGYRWRHAECCNPDTEYPDLTEVDQLNILVDHLRENPSSRRAVLSMWNVNNDLLRVGGTTIACELCNGTGYHRYKDHLDGRPNYSGSAACGACKGTCRVYCRTCQGNWSDDKARARGMGELPRCPACNGRPRDEKVKDPGSKDVCCNLDVMFLVRTERRSAQGPGKPDAQDQVLDMTVTNRSNDMLWGMLGANYVHFSILQEYVAARLNMKVGRYHHFSNNLHVYCDRPDWKPLELLDVDRDDEQWGPGLPLVQNRQVFEEELPDLVDRYSGRYAGPGAYKEPFLAHVGQPMFTAWQRHKLKEHDGARQAAEAVQAEDWRRAALAWLGRRTAKRA